MNFDQLQPYFQNRTHQKLILSNNKEVLLKHVLTHRNSVSLWFTYKLNEVNIEIDYSLRSDAILHVPEICLGNLILTKHMKFNKISSLLYHIKYSLENWVEDIDSNDVLEWR